MGTMSNGLRRRRRFGLAWKPMRVEVPDEPKTVRARSGSVPLEPSDFHLHRNSQPSNVLPDRRLQFRRRKSAELEVLLRTNSSDKENAVRLGPLLVPHANSRILP